MLNGHNCEHKETIISISVPVVVRNYLDNKIWAIIKVKNHMSNYLFCIYISLSVSVIWLVCLYFELTMSSVLEMKHFSKSYIESYAKNLAIVGHLGRQIILWFNLMYWFWKSWIWKKTDSKFKAKKDIFWKFTTVEDIIKYNQIKKLSICFTNNTSFQNYLSTFTLVELKLMSLSNQHISMQTDQALQCPYLIFIS